VSPNGERRLAYGPITELRDISREDQHHCTKGTKRVAHVDEHPVAQEFGACNAARGPGHSHQIVAREQLSAANNYENQPQTESQPPNQATDTEP